MSYLSAFPLNSIWVSFFFIKILLSELGLFACFLLSFSFSFLFVSPYVSSYIKATIVYHHTLCNKLLIWKNKTIKKHSTCFFFISLLIFKSFLFFHFDFSLFFLFLFLYYKINYSLILISEPYVYSKRFKSDLEVQ